MKTKENTKRKLKDAVGKIFKTEGLPRLGVNKVAHNARINKKFTYRYFMSFEELVETVLLKRIYEWYLQIIRICLIF